MTGRISIFLACLAATCRAEAPKLRLDHDVRPVKYAVDLKLLTDRSDFTGSIDIDIDVRKPSPILWLNAKEIAIKLATINGQAAGVEPGTADFIGLRPATALTAGPAKLRLEYSGKISPKNTEGIFQGRDGNNLYLFTQFESIDARRAFPCFDQPDFKTPWQVTLHVKRGEKAFSNTPQVSETNEPGGMKRVAFAETKPLPSYLIAFAVGPFDVVAAGMAGRNHAPVRIITPKGLAYQAKYAAQVTATIVDRLENYFGIPYPFEKIDNMAIPLTYGFGAMENAGLVTYEQTILLADPSTDTDQRQRRYASVAAHELAHQWFGDLVTLAWWDDTWLNEAFATWTSSKILAQWKPEWKTRVEDLGPKFNAMGEDSLVNTRKIHQPIETADDIENAFDDITYEKGSAVIRMFESWVGEKQFQSGVTAYLKQYSNRNARMADFLDAIAGTGQPRLTSAFTTFLDQPGFPEISVEVKCAGAPAVELSQKRYLPIGSGGSQTQVWQVPVCVRYKTAMGLEQECFLLDKPSAEFRLTKAAGCPSILWANDHASGYYVDAYSSEMRSKLIGQGSEFLDPAEQVTLVNDLSRLASAGGVKASVALGAVPVYGKSDQREVVAQTEDLLSAVRPLVPANLRENYARFVRKVYGERAAALGWSSKPGEGPDIQMLRRAVVPFVAVEGDDPVLQAEARRLADGWLKDRTGIDPGILTEVLSAAAHSGDRAYFDRLLEELQKTRDLRQRRAIIEALGSFRNPKLVDAAHQLVIHSDIDGRESQRLLFAGNDDPATEDMAFQFVKANYAELIKRLPSGGGSEAGARLPGVIAGCDARAEDELKFFEERVKEFAGGPRTFEQVKERVKLCEARKSAMGEDVAEFFAKQ
jgi:cytosol alanyl aminopeptidase